MDDSFSSASYGSIWLIASDCRYPACALQEEGRVQQIYLSEDDVSVDAAKS